MVGFIFIKKKECPEISVCETLENLFWRNYFWNKDCQNSSEEGSLMLGIWK